MTAASPPVSLESQLSFPLGQTLPELGQVLQVAKSYAWVRPCGLLPLEVERVFARAERDFEDFEGEPMVYVALADIAEVGLGLAVGTTVLFRPYISCKGVGGCEVIPAWV